MLLLPTRRALAVFAMLACSGTGAFAAADWYVSPGGNDRWTGKSEATAFRNLSQAATVVNPGDTVWVATGSYLPVTLQRSGSAGAPITWKAIPGNTPEIAYNSNWNGAWYAMSVSASYQVIDGFTMTGNNDNVTLAQAEADYADAGGGSPVFNNSGITLDNRNKNGSARANHLTVKNSTFRKFGCAGVAVLNADYTVIENNEIYDNAWFSRYGCSGATIFTSNGESGSGYHNFVRGNLFWNNRGLVKWKDYGDYSDGNGFILDTSDADYTGSTLVSNNLAVNNGGSGLHAFQAKRADFVNNTAYMNGSKVGYADIYAAESTDIRLLNNVSYSRVGGKSTIKYNNTNVTYDYNVYFNGTREITGAHDVVADPMFVSPGLDPRTADFRLRPGSPAIDNAVVLSGVSQPTDLAGVSRPRGAGLDRGAYEFAAEPAITSALQLSAQVGIDVSYRITASGGATSFNATGLPDGMWVDGPSGWVGGKPKSAGSSAIVISATNDVGTATATLVLTIAAPPPTITSPLQLSSQVGTDVSYRISGSDSPTSFNAEGLPAGMWVDGPSGWVGGKPQSPGTSSVVLSATNGTGTGKATLTINVAAQAAPAPSTSATSALPSGYTGAVIGAAATGSATESSGTWTLQSKGGDIWDRGDNFEFASRAMSGDVRVTACVESLGNSDPWAKAGIMLRSQTWSNATHATVVITPSNGVAFQRRYENDGGSTHTAGAMVKAPYCMRLVRVGDTVTGYSSADGTTWATIRRDTVKLGTEILVGLVASSHSATASTTATFTRVVIEPATAGK